MGEMRHEHFPIFHPSYSCYFLQLLIVIVSFRFLHCNVIYLAHAYILYFLISNCNVFVYVTLAFFKVSYCNCFYCNDFCRLGQSQTYPEEERPCLSKYWNGKYISLTVKSALLLYYLFEHSLGCEKFESQNFSGRISYLLPTCQEKLMEELSARSMKIEYERILGRVALNIRAASLEGVYLANNWKIIETSPLFLLECAL